MRRGFSVVHKEAEYLERMWLLLAEQLDITSRGEQVSHLVFRTMEFNKAGYIVNMYEGFHCGVQNFPKAAECFRRAFEATGQRDFVSGERYAWAQLNANRPMDAIDGLDILERKSTSLGGGGGRMSMSSSRNAITSSVQAMRNQALTQLLLRSDGEQRSARPHETSTRRLSRS